MPRASNDHFALAEKYILVFINIFIVVFIRVVFNNVVFNNVA